MARVLVVDDVPDARKAAARLLARCGHVATTAAGGREALEMAKTLRPHVVLLDIAMPEVDGFEVLRRLPHACPGMPPPAVVMLSAYDDAASQQLAQSLGAQDYLVKGKYDPASLCAIVDDLADNYGPSA